MKTVFCADWYVYTGYTFSRKISAALAGFLLQVFMLTQIGYIPNNIQSDTTLLGLRQLIFMACGLAIIVLIHDVFSFYKLNEQRFAFIIEEIAQRKKTGNQIVATNNKQSISTVNTKRRLPLYPSQWDGVFPIFENGFIMKLIIRADINFSNIHLLFCCLCRKTVSPYNQASDQMEFMLRVGYKSDIAGNYVDQYLYATA